MRKLFFAIIILTLGAAAVAKTSRSNKSSVARNITIFNAVLKELQTNYVDTIDADALVQTAIDAMLNRIDPYTEYYPYENREDLTAISTGQYGGIGAYIQRRPAGTIVSEPVYGSPAQQAGIRHGDVIIEVDGVDVTRFKESDKVSRLLRGQAGTDVKVKVRRPYVEDSILTFDITRRTINMNPMPYYGVDSAGVGYIRLTTFNEKSAELVKDALVDMKRNPDLRGVVLDLRGNGGGILEGAVQIVGLFVPKGTEVVRHSGFEGKNLKIYKTAHQPVDTEIPLVVMVDGGTASSSEITAGALQDLDRAVVVGSRSFGKGLVQTSRPLPYDGLLKVTMAHYYIPSGRLIQAIDYSRRNPDGSPMHIPDSLTKVWKTKHGRDVRDGGGITPDVAVSDTSINRLIYNVVADNWAFDYANRFRARNESLPAASEWIMPDSIFTAFKAFIDPTRFKYDKACEQGIDYLRKAAEAEGYMNDSVKAQIELLAGMLKHDLDHDLDFNKANLVRILDTEISERYYDEGDRVMRALRYDMELDTARAVVLDRDRYNALLRPSK
ncbi:MAG: S41 family peptidase [Muribaculaceae bacterium]